MSAKIKRRHRMSFWDKADLDVLEATSENFRIEVDRAFQMFLSDASLKEYSFSVTLNNLERKYIHQKASTYNLMSRSHGKDPNRILTIYKKLNKSIFESFYIDLAEKSKLELRRVVRTFSLDKNNKPVVKLPSNEKIFGRLSLGPPPLVAGPSVSPEIKAFQTTLPLFELKEMVLDKIWKNQVLIVSSETGSGKTTQIPQYIMDEARARGERCRIICTQPRRISAVTVAERVAEERGSILGETVGYHIRLESKLGTNCNLIYCTNGVLIRSLMSGDRVLSSLTHIIIDEVHERDKLSDFLLVCLRESLKKGMNIKLILMSATINLEKFHDYFYGADILSVPGRLFPIKEIFLDEILMLTGYDEVVMEKRYFCSDPIPEYKENGVVNPQFDDIITQCLQTFGLDNEQAWSQLLQFMLNEDMPVDYQHSDTGMTALMVAVCQNNVGLVEQLCSLGADPKIQAKKGVTALSLARDHSLEEIILLLTKGFQQSRDEILSNYYKTVADEDINYELLTKLICTIHNKYPEGAILVFLPGYDDIMMCYEYILNSDLSKSSYKVFFLHGSMNIKEQHQLFQTISVRKIILSTNIAETSLTINDVVYVIDSGKAKVQTYDSCSGLSSLQVQWISKACVKQRAGRAGRTQSGICFHLYSKLRFQSFLDERVPEILRVPLEELCLNTKTLAGNVTSIYNFLVLAPDPPSPNSVKTAIENLECLGALDKDENLTLLGEYLSQLTIEPHLGKMLIYAAIFRCLDPILTIVASLAQKDPFQLPPQASLRSSAAEKRRSLTANTFSDHMVYLKAFVKWQESVKSKKERAFCRDFFISPSTMETILKTRSQLLGQLRAAKFVPPHGHAMISLNTYSENWPLVKAVISSGLYPKLAFKINGLFCTRTEKKILIHNSSPLSKENINLWLVYDEMVKARSGHQVRGVTPVTPITISLMCGIKSESSLENHMTIDEWLEFEFPSQHILHLRKCIEHITEKKLCSPMNPLNASDELALHTLASILVNEDEAAGMDIPNGMRPKPKFFELNRIQEGVFSCPKENYSRNISINEPPFHSVPSTSNSNYLTPFNYDNRSNKMFPRQNISPRPHNGLDNLRAGYDSPIYYPKNGGQLFFDSKYNSRCNCVGCGHTPTNFVVENHYGAKAHYGNQNMQPHVDAFSYHLPSPLNPTSDDRSAPPKGGASQPVDNALFLLIRVKQENSIRIAYDTSKWVFSPQTEKQIIASDNAGVTVYLLYTVHRMNTFYGIAQFLSIDRSRSKLYAQIDWKFKVALPYKKVSHLRNPLNNNRLIYEGSDGQVVSRDAALKLWDMFALEEQAFPGGHFK